MKKTKDTNKGITLIALVITIIVMLILVAVTITMAVNGGLFEYASKAGKEMNEDIKSEQELGSGRIKIGSVWYDSPQDYANGKPSANQGEEAEEEEEPEEEVTSISVAEALEVKHTEEAQLTVSIVPDIIVTGITYSSSNPAVATVDNTGKVTGLSVGTSTITVTYKGFSDTCTVTVIPKVTSISVSGIPNGDIKEGDTFKLNVTTAPDAVSSGISFESKYENVATVTDDGYVTAEGLGVAEITVIYGSGEEKITETVYFGVVDESRGEGPEGGLDDEGPEGQ